MKVRTECSRHKRQLTGLPNLVRFDGELSWEVDTSEMSCPSWAEEDQCQGTWAVVGEK